MKPSRLSAVSLDGKERGLLEAAAPLNEVAALAPRITVRRATLADAIYIEENLRPADFEEFVMARGRSPRQLFRISATKPGTMVGLLDDVPACVYGVFPFEDFAVPWMMGTSAIEGRAIGRILIRHGRKLFAEWAARYGTLRNYVYARNALHIRYIKALGCKLMPPEPAGAIGAPFREFTYNV
jgi:hypothetical protein